MSLLSVASSVSLSSCVRSEAPTSLNVPETRAATNYSRIACLLMDEGTKRAEEAVRGRLPGNKGLTEILEENQTKFYNLMTKQRVITKKQYDTLFPFDGDTSKIDITLWLVLARNVTEKKWRRNIDWSKYPKKEDTLWGHDLIRLKEIRNRLFHISRAELDEEIYTEIRTAIIDVLLRLGTSEEVIEDYLTRDLDPQKTKINELQIKEQHLQDQNLLLHRMVKHKHQNWIICTALCLLAFLILLSIILSMTYMKKSCGQSLVTLKSHVGGIPYMPRSGWSAAALNYQHLLTPLKRPIQKISVHHTASIRDFCDDTNICCEKVRNIQRFHIEDVGFTDVAFNYLIGNDGVVYEGRGAYAGAAVWGRNSKIISIAMLGNYVCTSPSNAAMTTLHSFLEYMTDRDPSSGQRRPMLAVNYTLYGHCQLNINSKEHRVIFPDSPGAGVMQKIMLWNHWNQCNLTQCSYCKDCLTSDVCNKSFNRTGTDCQHDIKV